MTSTRRLPARLVVAGVASGVGKTTIATGLMAALRARGRRVASAKVGADYIDPGYHALATGRPGRNLDIWMSGANAIGGLAVRASEHADLLIIEGVMGLFDGARDGTPSSTAEVAKLLDAPVLLVVDAGAMSDSVAALVHGFTTYDKTVTVAGVILNRVGSDQHEAMLRRALETMEVPVLGVLRRNDALKWRERHLGLVPVIEAPTETLSALDRLAASIARSVDLTAIERVAHAANPRTAGSIELPCHRPRARVGIPSGPAFSFVYPDNLEALRAHGAELVPFDALEDPSLPGAIDGLYIGGGFPEVFADQLAANTPLLAHLSARVGSGLPTWAECGGLLWLCDTLNTHRMAGVVPAAATMTNRLTLGYRHVEARTPSPIAAAGEELRGHEYHYSTLDNLGDGFDATGDQSATAFATPTMMATYLHLHLGASSHVAARFVATCMATSQDPDQ